MEKIEFSVCRFYIPQKLDQQIGWHKLGFLGQNRIIKSFSYWVFIIPVLAQLFHMFCISELFPDKLIILYLVSLCFATGNVIYYVYCPEFIKDFFTFEDYCKHDQTFNTLMMSIIEQDELREKMENESNSVGNPDGSTRSRPIYSWFISTFKTKEDTNPVERPKLSKRKQVQNTKFDEELLPTAYLEAIDEFSMLNMRGRIFCAIFYFLGLCLILLLIIINTISVLL